jgi:hypothetical protein
MIFYYCKLVNRQEFIIIGIIEIDQLYLVAPDVTVDVLILNIESFSKHPMKLVIVAQDIRAWQSEDFAQSFVSGIFRYKRIKPANCTF